METIIALLFVALPIIFKLIGRKLEKSGKLDQAARMRKVAEELGMDPDEGDFAKWFQESEHEDEREAELPGDLVDRPVVEERPVRNVEQFAPKVSVPTSVRPNKAKKPILKEEEPKKREKIDPKKLVIYSEIMKPKYTE